MNSNTPTPTLGMTLQQLEDHCRVRMEGRLDPLVLKFIYDCVAVGYPMYLEQAREKQALTDITDAQKDLYMTLADAAPVLAKQSNGDSMVTVPLERIASVLRTLTESSAFRVAQYEHQFALETALAEAQSELEALRSAARVRGKQI